MIEQPTSKNKEAWKRIAQKQECDLIYQAIEQLPRKYREVIVLCHLQGRSRTEAAEMLNMSEPAVKAALGRGRNLLRKRLLYKGIVTTTLLMLLSQQSHGAQTAVSENVINATLQFCKGQPPTFPVGTDSTFVQTLASQGAVSMQTLVTIKSLTIAATAVFCLAIPLWLVAQQQDTADAGISLGTTNSGTLVASQGTGFVLDAGTQDSDPQEREKNNIWRRISLCSYASVRGSALGTERHGGRGGHDRHGGRGGHGRHDRHGGQRGHVRSNQ